MPRNNRQRDRRPRNRTSNHHRHTYNPPPAQPGRSRGLSRFEPDAEHVERSTSQSSNEPDLANADPYRHYTMRSGKHRGKTVAQVDSTDRSYINWMYRQYYNRLYPSHIIRRALKQWAEDSDTHAFPPLVTAPARFKEGNRDIFMSQRFLKKHWHVTADELEEAGVRCMDSIASRTGAKKFALWHVYLYAIREGRMDRREADEKAAEEAERTLRLRNGYNMYRNGDYAGGGLDDFADFGLW